MSKLTPLLICFGLITSCSTVPTNIDRPITTYAEPILNNYANSKNFNYSTDAVWDALIDYASESFFAIDTYEKASGLMTLSFSAKPQTYVNCGTVVTENSTPVDYISALLNEQYFSANLNGTINIRVSGKEDGSTNLTVNARYILDTTFSRMVYNQFNGSFFPFENSESYTFDSKSVDTISSKLPFYADTESRTCGPTGLVEATIIDGVNSILKKK